MKQRINNILMMRARGLSGPFMQRTSMGYVHTTGNYLGGVGGLLWPHLVNPAFVGEGDWVTATAYAEGDLVAHDGGYYLASQGHTSGATTEPGAGDDWEDYWTEVKLYSDTAEAFVLPSTLSLTVEEGSTAAVDRPLYLQSIDSSGAALSWTLAESPATAWVGADNLSGSGPMALSTVTFDPTGLADGEYTTDLVFTAAGAAESPITIPVTLTVAPVGEFVLLESGDGFILTEDDFFAQQEITA